MNGVLTKGEKRYFMTLIDDATRFCYVYLLRTKDEALDYLKIYKAEVENQLERKIKRLRSDRGGEYFPKIFDEFCEEHVIIHERTPPYSPQSNGVAERKNRTLSDLVNSMLDTAGLSKAWWGEALLTACHVLNRVPNKNKEKTPYEEWVGRKPPLSYLCTWGCLAKVNIPIPKKRKLGPKTVDCIFLGYAQRSIGHRFLVVKSELPDMHVDTIMESRDATFFENMIPMKDMHSTARFSSEIITESSASNYYFEQPHENVFEDVHAKTMKLLQGARDEGLQSPLVMMSLCTLWMIIPRPLLRHMHHQMQMIGKKLSKMRWTLFFLMEHGNYQSAPMAVSLWAASGSSRRS
jgi:hypothetical protein